RSETASCWLLIRSVFRHPVSTAGRSRSVGDLRHDGTHQATGGNELRPLGIHCSQELPAGGVEKGHARQVKAKDRLVPAGQGALPATLQLPHPGACQPPFELERQGAWLLVDGYAKHRSLVRLVPFSFVASCKARRVPKTRAFRSHH